ncbi:hypothetical protein D3C81_1232350 [compost metagenome]
MVVAPGAAHRGAALQQQDGLKARLAKLDGHALAGETGADDDDLGVQVWRS